MRRLDPLTLRVFLAALRSGSIAEAARRENLAASAASKRIAELEARFGLALLQRGPRGVTATAAGEMVARHAESLTELLERLDREVAEYARGAGGEVRIVAVTSAIAGPLAADIADFERAQPAVRVKLREEWNREAVPLVEDGVVDLGVLADHGLPARLERHDFADDPIWVAGPRGHPLFQGRPADAPVAFAETLEHDIVALRAGGSVDAIVVAAASMIDRPLRRHVEVSRFESLRRLVEVGIGIGFLRRSAVLPYLGSLAIDARPLSDAWAARKLVLVSRGRTSLPPAAARFHDFLLQRRQPLPPPSSPSS